MRRSSSRSSNSSSSATGGDNECLALLQRSARDLAQSTSPSSTINPAGYSSGYPALAAAITQVAYPTIEVHISNPAARGGSSQIAPSCKGVITGFGLFGYYIAMKAVIDMDG